MHGGDSPLFGQLTLFESPQSSYSGSFITAPTPPYPPSMTPPISTTTTKSFVHRTSSFGSDPPPSDPPRTQATRTVDEPDPPSSSTSFSTRFFPHRHNNKNDKTQLPHSIANAKITPFDLTSTTPTTQGELEDSSSSKEEDWGKRALGPASGREFLALRHQLNLDHAEAEAGEIGGEIADESGFSIRERIPVRPFVRPPRSESTGLERKNTGTTMRTGTAGSPTSSRRKLVPATTLIDEEHVSPKPADDTPTPRARGETTLLRRDAILNASPTNRPSRRPPIAGLNHESPRITPRVRSNSNDSTGSVSKDSVLRELGEAIRKERRRKEMFEQETGKAKVEMAEIEENLTIMREKFATLDEQQDLTIRNLNQEIEELEEELATADLLDEQTAEEYLSLLSAPSLSHLAHHQPVQTFDPSLLVQSSSSHAEFGDSVPPRPATVRNALKFKRGMTLKRRIENHLAAHDDPSISRPQAGGPQDVMNQNTRGRRLSKTHRERRSMAPSPNPVASSQPPPPQPIFQETARRPPVSGVSKIAAFEAQEEVKEGRGRTRKRSLREGFNGTMRVLFPSNATGTGSKGSSEGKQVTNWLRAA
ncbi:uncharacterized protein JCM6883_001297 [Sporobolomyces salmoneus]|uniref:uncharacterized protein n=1 Tax=Sporobolomyces salmoneus TaxID=183962 RepID=UPI00317896E6